MKRLFLFVFALFAFAACTEVTIEEKSVVKDDAAETITVGFDDEATRIQLNEAQKSVWTKDDLVSVFYRTNGNQKWQYQGETGERIGTLKRVENAMGSMQTTKTVVVYPYSEDYWLNTSSYCIDAVLPATQYYAEGSYGVGSNLMVSQGEFTQFSLKSVCGWLKLQLTGNGEVVKSIKFRGNNGEQVAGLIYVDTNTAEATLAAEMGGTDDNNAGGNLVFDDTILTEVTLDCGASVELGTEATSFYISLPPQTFEGGFTVEVECEGYELMTLSTENELVIERNTIQPMASVEHDAPYYHPNNEIWYTNGSATEPINPDQNAFGVNILSNTYNANMECWVIKFDGDVTTIGDDAFFYDFNLTGISIPHSVTSIGGAAFWSCYNLTSIDIPDGVTTIGDRAFAYCISLKSVTIPDSVTTIENRAFFGCYRLTNVTIGDGVTTIGDNAFRSCNSLAEFKGKLASDDGRCLIIDDTLNSFAIGSGVTEYVIPDGITTIGEGAFAECSSLTSVTISNSVTSIKNSAFASCLNLTQFSGKFASDDGRCLIVGGTLNSFAPAGLTEYTIPANVTTIGNSTFVDCSNLISVTISDGVTTIETCAFENCSGLTSVTISDSVTAIGYGAFSDCTNLTSVYIKDLSAWCRVVFDYSANPLSSGANLYLNNELVTELVIPSDITEVKSYAFEDCISLISVTIPNSVTNIGECAFKDCDSLESITISDSVTNIEQHAFMNCPSLISVYCKAVSPPRGGLWMLKGNAADRKIYVPAESVDAYKAASYWSDYADAIVAYDFENNKEVNTVEFNPNNCIYYRTNSTGGWDSGWNNYRRTDSYIECGGGGNTLEMKFKLEPFSGEVWLAASGNLAKDYCDELIIDNSIIELILRARDEDGDGYTVYYKSWKLADFGVSSTDLITLTLSGETITINGKTLSCPSIPYMSWSYVFSNYYRENDEGEWKVYEGVPENSALYYVKMCDADGNLTYLGHADKSINSATNNMEYCWYSNKSGTERYQFANDAVNQGGYGGNF